MSAILGVLHRDGRSIEPSALARMSETLAPWGADASGMWHSGPVGVGQRTLVTTPESLEENPADVLPAGTLVVVADARIDNRDELAASLRLDPHLAVRLSDTEYIRRAYERWGDGCPERLLGDFAFAIWDSKEGEFFCARDAMGVRPFYYHLSDRVFAFASQIRALLSLPSVPRRLNEGVLADYLALLAQDKVQTFYSDILRLPPGHLLHVSRERRTQRCYWKLDPSRGLRLGSDGEYAEAFGEIFGEAVRCRLRSHGPVAAMLSGGLDSSSIVATARRMLTPGQRLVTLSGVFPSLRSPDSVVDEQRYVDLVTGGGGVDAHFVRADAASPIFDFLWRGEEPIPAAALYMDWCVFRAAKDLGVRVLLSGNDGDSVVGFGRAYLSELAWTGGWKTLLGELRALSRRYGVGRRDLVRQYVLSTFVPFGLTSAWQRLRTNGRQVYDRRSVIRREFADRTGVWDRARLLLREERPVRRERKAHYESVNSSLLTLLLELFARGAGTFGVEPRYPFFDRRLVAFCLALPGDQKLHQGRDRVVMRRAMEGLLPAEIQWRSSKQNLSQNFNLRLLDNRDLLEEVIFREASFIEPYVDVGALRAAFRRYSADPPHRTQDSFTVFWAVTIMLWLRHSGLAT
ncbi:MAG: asparagine synthetase B [Gemmatimonadales bacterium]|nr:asparagine synthetase B [Gemmatimonadales bacterium]